MRRKASILIVFLSLFFSGFIPSTSSATPDLNKYVWPPSYATSNSGDSLLGYQFTLVDDFSQGGLDEASSIRTSAGQRYCKNFKDPKCVMEIEAGAYFGANQVLPPCENLGELINCIEAVNLIYTDGNSEKLVLEKLIPGNTWPEDKFSKVEAGSSASRWISESDKNPKKGFKVTVSGELKIRSSRFEVFDAQLDSFQASVEPYEKIEGNYSPRRMYESSIGRFLTVTSPNYCIWVDTNECGVLTEFPEDAKVELVLHLPTEISGWIMGRVNQPIFKAQSLGISRITGQSLTRVTVSGFPVNVPMFSTKVDLANASPELKSYWQENKFCKEKLKECVGYFGGWTAGNLFEAAYKYFKLYEIYFNETSTVVIPRWSMRTLPKTDESYNRCKSESISQINGLVTTNSSIYQGAPPTFEDNTFVYKVAGLHLLPNKEIFQGTYDLVLKSEFARCLYGFSNAPIKASVEVTGADGSTKIATTSFIEKDGWMYLSVKGFTFSQPTIKLKLSQEKEIVTPSTTPDTTQKAAPTSTKVLPRKLIITCIKGKTIKKVTGTKPSCPPGYKKK